MADNQWAYDLETVIYSIIKNGIEPKLKELYPDTYITNIAKNTAKASFPTVYIHEMPGVEVGSDLSGTVINGIRETFQVDITTNKSQNDAKKAMSIVVEAFKALRFKVTAMPEFESTDETYRSTARFQRVIGANDIL